MHCFDEIKNGDEWDVDCGGSCKPCKGMHFGIYILCM